MGSSIRICTCIYLTHLYLRVITIEFKKDACACAGHLAREGQERVQRASSTESSRDNCVGNEEDEEDTIRNIEKLG